MLGRWDPFVEMSRLQDELSRMGAQRDQRDKREIAFQPVVDIFEDEGHIFVKAELPGVKPDDVNISVENHVLTLSGERKFERETNRDGYHRIESTYGAFTRSFSLPQTVDTESIDASMDHGVLTLKLPKRAEAQPRRISVKGASSSAPEPRVMNARADKGGEPQKSASS